MSVFTRIYSYIVMILLFSVCTSASAASGEMGTGIPHFGVYSDAVGAHVKIWSLANATRNFPSGCTSLVITSSTAGLDFYKMTIATLLAAKASGIRVRFFAHGERDGGCSFDYIELQDP